MKAFTVLAALLFCVGFAVADDPATCAKAKAKGVLALARAQRERETAIAGKRPACLEDYQIALSTAIKLSKPLAIWVGMRCTDEPEICSGIAGDVVSCHQNEFNGDKTPRLLIAGKPGKEVGWSVFDKERLAAKRFTVADIRRAYAPAVSLVPNGFVGFELSCPNGNCPQVQRRQ